MPTIFNGHQAIYMTSHAGDISFWLVPALSPHIAAINSSAPSDLTHGSAARMDDEEHTSAVRQSLDMTLQHVESLYVEDDRDEAKYASHSTEPSWEHSRNVVQQLGRHGIHRIWHGA